MWPDVRFYDKQVEVINSVLLPLDRGGSEETFVVAGHQLGKDFVSGFIVVAAFLTHPIVRIITTSVKDDHLRVLWGEIGRFISDSVVPLTADKGGPLIFNHRDMRKVNESPGYYSYLRGMVSKSGEGMAGHHAPFTLFVGDEASALPDRAYKRAKSWAKKMLLIGNPYGSGKGCFGRGIKG